VIEPSVPEGVWLNCPRWVPAGGASNSSEHLYTMRELLSRFRVVVWSRETHCPREFLCASSVTQSCTVARVVNNNSLRLLQHYCIHCHVQIVAATSAGFRRVMHIYLSYFHVLLYHLAQSPPTDDRAKMDMSVSQANSSPSHGIFCFGAIL
jgi:hypothetical protein